MATFGEKQADVATLLDDIRNTALTVTQEDGVTDAYEHIDSATVDNSGGSDDWKDNGFVLRHVESGMYLTFYLCGYRFQDERYDPDSHHTGIRVVHSNDYDLANHVPFGKTDIDGGVDHMAGAVGNHRGTSFVWQDGMEGYYSGAWGTGLYWRNGNVGENGFRAESVTYAGAIGADYINLVAYSNDPNNGRAGFFTFEHLDEKFWQDGNEPYVTFCKTNTGWRGGRSAQYGFQHFRADGDFNNDHNYDVGGFDGTAWGKVNPDVDDDTFFFRRPVVYQTQNKNIPVGYAEETICNDRDEGGAHGDVVTYNGKDYFIFRQPGGSTGDIVSTGFRNE